MHSVMHNNQPDGGVLGFDHDIMPPPPAWQPYGGDAMGGWLLPTVGTYANATCRAGLGDHCPDPTKCCTGYPQPNQDWLFNSINQFSAACWHFAEHLTDIMEKNNETLVPFGLVSSQWGGTMVECVNTLRHCCGTVPAHHERAKENDARSRVVRPVGAPFCPAHPHVAICR